MRITLIDVTDFAEVVIHLSCPVNQTLIVIEAAPK